MTILWIVIAVLVGVLVLFKLADWLIKRQPKAKSTPAKKESPNPAKPSAPKDTKAVTEAPTSIITGTNLADDLEQALNVSAAAVPAATETPANKHLRPESRIRNYIRDKNYHIPAAEMTADSDEDAAENFTFDDYRRVMALSNIPEHK